MDFILCDYKDGSDLNSMRLTSIPMQNKQSSTKRNETTIPKKRPLRKFASAALLAGSLMGCAAPAQEARPVASQCSVEQGLKSGDRVDVVLLSEESGAINGAIKLQVADVDASGAEFDFTLIYAGKIHELKFRANFDGSRSGDLRPFSFFGKDEFSVAPHCGGVKVRFRETIIKGLSEFQKKKPSGSCPANLPRGTVCT